MKKLKPILMFIAATVLASSAFAAETTVVPEPVVPLMSPIINAEQSLPLITVYKRPTCGCCLDWIAHLEKFGFKVKAVNVNDLQPYKTRAKLASYMGSCHTAFIGKYVVEGHVPAWDIKQMLAKKPDITGLAVPGMPIGSPGMEPLEGQKAEAYDVISYKDGKKVDVFKHYPAR